LPRKEWARAGDDGDIKTEEKAAEGRGAGEEDDVSEVCGFGHSSATRSEIIFS
jgi:hypothetical protein